MHKKWSELQETPWSGEKKACFAEEYRKPPFQVIRVRIHEGNSKLVSFWSKLRNVGQVRIAKWRIELSSMFFSRKMGVLIFLCFLWIIEFTLIKSMLLAFVLETHTLSHFSHFYFSFSYILQDIPLTRG